jgi:hypothetical protein
MLNWRTYPTNEYDLVLFFSPATSEDRVRRSKRFLKAKIGAYEC